MEILGPIVIVKLRTSRKEKGTMNVLTFNNLCMSVKILPTNNATLEFVNVKWIHMDIQIITSSGAFYC